MFRRLFATLAFVALGAMAQASPLPDYPFVTVQGSAARDVTPTTVRLKFSVSAQASTAQAVVETLQRASATVVTALSEAGISAANINASELNKQARTRWDEAKNTSVFDGYDGTRAFVVTIGDLKVYPALMTRLFALPETTDFSPAFDIAEREAAERSLVDEAAQQAKANAGRMAASLGATVKGVRAISEQPFEDLTRRFGFGYDYGGSEAALSAQARKSAEALLVPATIHLAKSVNVVFEIQ